MKLNRTGSSSQKIDNMITQYQQHFIQKYISLMQNNMMRQKNIWYTYFQWTLT